MKKLPRKFSEGGKTAPAPQPKPQDKKDSMPDWAKKDLEQKNQDAKTKAGYEKATAPDRLKNYKAGGKVRKFAEGDEVKGRFSESDPDIYKRALSSVARKNAEEAGEAGSIKEPPGAAKPKPTAKLSAKPAAKPVEKPAPKKDENYSNEGRNAARKTEESPAPFKSVSERMKEARETTRRGEGSTTDTRSVSERVKQAIEENPKTAAALGFGASMLPLAGPAMRGIQALRAMRQASGVMSSGASRAAANRMAEAERAGEAAASRDLIKRSGAKQRAEKESMDLERDAMPVKRKAPRDLDEERMAGEGGPNFKRGGMAKYAKGGGVESKGKTKGTVVKMAKGGSVKGWGISRGAKACKMV